MDHSLAQDHLSCHGDERRLLLALSITAVFMAAEVIGGLVSGSLTLLADAGHMLTDAASLALAYAALKAAQRQADQKRTYGYHRAQVLAAFVNGLALLAITGWIVYQAIERLLKPVEVLGGLMLVIALAGLLANLITFLVLHGADKKNLNIRGAALHVLGDLIGSMAAIVAAGVILKTGWNPIDPILAFLGATLILRLAWYLVRDSAHILLEGAPEGFNVEKMTQILKEQVPAVLEVHHVHAWSLNPGQPLLTLHVRIDEGANATEILKQIKEVLREQLGLRHTTVQTERGKCPDAEKTCLVQPGL